MKKRRGYVQDKLKDVNSSKKFNVEKDFTPEELDQYKDIGMKAIADGKVCVIINGAGLAEKMKLTHPKICYYPGWPLECSVIEYFLKRLKGIGQCALKKYEKGYEGNREPIMVLLMINEYEIDEIENFLVGERYFGYTGIICLSQVNFFFLNKIFS